MTKNTASGPEKRATNSRGLTWPELTGVRPLRGTRGNIGLPVAEWAAVQGYTVLAMLPIDEARELIAAAAQAISEGRKPRWAPEKDKQPLEKWGQGEPAGKYRSPEELRYSRFAKRRCGVSLLTRQSGLVVVDIDSDDGEAWLADLAAGREIRTRILQTHNGRHLIFKDGGVAYKTQSGEIAPGVDIRGRGGIELIYDPSQPERHFTDLTEPAELPSWLWEVIPLADSRTDKAEPPALPLGELVRDGGIWPGSHDNDLLRLGLQARAHTDFTLDDWRAFAGWVLSESNEGTDARGQAREPFSQEKIDGWFTSADGVLEIQLRGDVQEAMWKAYVRKEGERLARERLASAKAPDLAQFGLTLYEELQQERKTEPPAVEYMANEGHVVSFPAVRKIGKTTLTVNLGISGLLGEKFLGRFATYLDGARGIAAINAEMTTDDYLDVWQSVCNGMRLEENEDHPLTRLHAIHCRDNGIRLNLLDDETMERFVGWLRDRYVSWLFLDPWKNFLSWAGIGLNDNDGVIAMLTRIQEIQEAAALSLVVIPMHMPQAVVEGEERAKGAGEFEDGADALWRYSRAKGGRDAPRFLSVEGRGGVGLDDTEVMFGPGGRLSLGDRSRSEAQDQHISDAVAEALALELVRLTGVRKETVTRLKYGELEGVVPTTARDKAKWINTAVSKGTVIRDAEGQGRPTWFSLPDEEPASVRAGRPGRGRNRGKSAGN